jgi:hypothetical protein
MSEAIIPTKLSHADRSWIARTIKLKRQLEIRRCVNTRITNPCLVYRMPDFSDNLGDRGAWLRARAQEIREVAGPMVNPDLQLVMFSMAEAYENLARHLETMVKIFSLAPSSPTKAA